MACTNGCRVATTTSASRGRQGRAGGGAQLVGPGLRDAPGGHREPAAPGPVAEQLVQPGRVEVAVPDVVHAPAARGHLAAGVGDRVDDDVRARSRVVGDAVAELGDGLLGQLVLADHAAPADVGRRTEAHLGQQPPAHGRVDPVRGDHQVRADGLAPGQAHPVAGDVLDGRPAVVALLAEVGQQGPVERVPGGEAQVAGALVGHGAVAREEAQEPAGRAHPLDRDAPRPGGPPQRLAVEDDPGAPPLQRRRGALVDVHLAPDRPQHQRGRQPPDRPAHHRGPRPRPGQRLDPGRRHAPSLPAAPRPVRRANRPRGNRPIGTPPARPRRVVHCPTG